MNASFLSVMLACVAGVCFVIAWLLRRANENQQSNPKPGLAPTATQETKSGSTSTGFLFAGAIFLALFLAAALQKPPEINIYGQSQMRFKDAAAAGFDYHIKVIGVKERQNKTDKVIQKTEEWSVGMPADSGRYERHLNRFKENIRFDVETGVQVAASDFFTEQALGNKIQKDSVIAKISQTISERLNGIPDMDGNLPGFVIKTITVTPPSCKIQDLLVTNSQDSPRMRFKRCYHIKIVMVRGKGQKPIVTRLNDGAEVEVFITGKYDSATADEIRAKLAKVSTEEMLTRGEIDKELEKHNKEIQAKQQAAIIEMAKKEYNARVSLKKAIEAHAKGDSLLKKEQASADSSSK